MITENTIKEFSLKELLDEDKAIFVNERFFKINQETLDRLIRKKIYYERRIDEHEKELEWITNDYNEIVMGIKQLNEKLTGK